MPAPRSPHCGKVDAKTTMITRTSYRPFVALGLVAGLLTYVGCSSPKTDTDKGSPAAAVVPPAPTGGMKEFANWPTPAGVLVI